jgi:imidazole glycerol-phosphate synthase subunit HisF
MRKIRIIPRLDIKSPNLIKGIHLEGLRVVGDPAVFSKDYYIQGADELLYIDSVASLYERNNILDLVSKTAQDVFVPMTVGGGIRTVEDARQALRLGADKVAVNTGAVKNPELISQIANYFGSQCMVVSIEAKQSGSNQWEVYVDNGREKTGIDLLDWVKQVQDFGAGEILLTSVDREGAKKGFDLNLINAVMKISKVPVIASGGMGNISHLINLIQETSVDAVAIANVLHYKTLSLADIFQTLERCNIEVRHTYV